MLYKPFLGAEMSGSMGGITASHNAGGQYFRSRVVPTDPATVGQVAVRSAVATLASRWAAVLTEAQRSAWNVYAANTPMLNRIGESRTISGIAQYIRSNAPMAAEGFLTVDSGPMTYMLPTLSGTGITADAATNTFDLFFDNTDSWATLGGGRLLLYTSRPQNSSVNFFKGPYRFTSSVAGNDPVAPTSPVTSIATPFAFAAGAKIFYQLRAFTADGRLSSPVRGSTVAV